MIAPNVAGGRLPSEVILVRLRMPESTSTFSAAEPSDPEKALHSMIRAEIEQSGPITLARFMELALYQPQYGYYEQPPRQTGRSGDFYTSVSVGSLFGELLAFDLAERLAALSGASPTLVEAGAHDGQLAFDLLTSLRQHRPALFQRLRYCLLEPSPTRTAWQRAKLDDFRDQVRWFPDWASLGSFEGVLFSNELLDAFPAHRWRWSRADRCWREIGVGLADGSFAWVPLSGPDPAAAALLPSLSPELAAILPDGFHFETHPAAVHWWASAARALTRGWLLTFDYGALEEDLLQPHRSAGTLRGYTRHRLQSNVLAAPGAQDLTTHVNFTRIIQAGEQAGLRPGTLQSQASFLMSIVKRVHDQPHFFPAWTPARRRQLATLVHPDHFGRAFRCLRQERP